ncbi:MAG TPA: response regulator transcription factor [Polyangiaceae bacterium LLY-WYZ-15_(1-7)]|nr:DNA-binding response regulator [Myxococcales bacterium]MAT27813.1 DNA-binding response regulator [Sandaracinus sp.]HJK94270.1 response regulator transcription factor [Polyangiaceae bacterium LLY-WYZ-15_(1-7)]MBJ73739.1 DNA-binding response regulator [Sandaracinus sp.]HJL05823.1 response regulator transcription factor [Polyangiaceae bacterium LLY-WYZ-15_(1-7)]
MSGRLLVVEDEEHLAAGLKLNLELEGYEVDVATTAREAGEQLLGPAGYDAIVLDIMLPDFDGFELCKRLRDAGNFVPVIMLTARSSAEDRVRGLEVGADDYLVKPFSLEELLARVRSVLRRREWEQGSRENEEPPRTLEFGRAKIDFDTHEVLVSGEPQKLTQLELDLLRYFGEHPHRVLSRDELMEKVWKLRNYSYTRTVDNFIARLRRHFEENPSQPQHFLSVRGAGYKFVPDPDATATAS